MDDFPTAEELLEEAKKQNANDLNKLHYQTWLLMIKHRKSYYNKKVKEFLDSTSLTGKEKEEIETKLLTPIVANGIEYSNFMEEASRRISQAFQVISGNIAEMCVEDSLISIGLKRKVHYLRKKERADFTFYSPNILKTKTKHRLEVKNVKLRERGVRGLLFDADSMVGFFDSPGEFVETTIKFIDDHCLKNNGYCYLPPETLKAIKFPTRRFKSNLQLAKDMKYFVDNGTMP